MIVFLNGSFLPEEEAKISIFDRSFLYGDGLFETIPVRGGCTFRLRAHLERLQTGAAYLNLRLAADPGELESAAAELLKRVPIPAGVLRITVSRGVGRRGYSTRGAETPLTLMTIHPSAAVEGEKPVQWRLVTASFRLAPHDPLARFKTANKLHQIVAKGEAEKTGADEALFLNTDGQFAEGTASNLFWVEQNRIYTTPLSSPALAGVTRAIVRDLCAELGITFREEPCPAERLFEAEGVFLSMSSLGIVEGITLDDRPLAKSPLTERLSRHYQQLVCLETAP